MAADFIQNIVTSDTVWSVQRWEKRSWQCAIVTYDASLRN